MNRRASRTVFPLATFFCLLHLGPAFGFGGAPAPARATRIARVVERIEIAGDAAVQPVPAPDATRPIETVREVPVYDPDIYDEDTTVYASATSVHAIARGPETAIA